MIKCQQICTDDSGIEDEDDASLMTSLNYPHRSKDELDSSHLSLDSVSNALAQAARAGFRPVREIARYGAYT